MSAAGALGALGAGQMPIETAEEVFLMCSAADTANRELITVFRDDTSDGVRRLGTIDVESSVEPAMVATGGGPEYTDRASAILVYNRKPELNFVDVPPIQLLPGSDVRSERVKSTFEAYVPPNGMVLTQAYGPIGGNTTVHIKGSHIPATDDLRVIFRDVVVHASLFLDERAVMQVVSPVCPGNAGPVDLVVAFTGILSTDSALTYTYYEEPEILMLFPAAGIWTGRADEVTPGQIVQGQGVKLSGTGFFSTPLIKCRFMSAGGTNVTTRGIFTQSDASLTCPYPSLNDTGMPLAGIPLEDVAGTPCVIRSKRQMLQNAHRLTHCLLVPFGNVLCLMLPAKRPRPETSTDHTHSLCRSPDRLGRSPRCVCAQGGMERLLAGGAERAAVCARGPELHVLRRADQRRHCLPAAGPHLRRDGSDSDFRQLGAVRGHRLRILLHLQAGDHEPGAQYDARSGSPDGAASWTL